MPEWTLSNMCIFSIMDIMTCFCWEHETVLSCCAWGPFLTAQSPTKSMKMRKTWQNRQREGHLFTVTMRTDTRKQGVILLELNWRMSVTQNILPFYTCLQMTEGAPCVLNWGFWINFSKQVNSHLWNLSIRGLTFLVLVLRIFTPC